ncbi:MAG: hypothetical protein WDM90_13045 [Ferruginibacter sp.]
MNRKHFLSTVIPIGAVLSAVANPTNIDEPNAFLKIPPYLKKGDTIGITCPAGFITLEDIQPAGIKNEGMGF